MKRAKSTRVVLVLMVGLFPCLQGCESEEALSFMQELHPYVESLLEFASRDGEEEEEETAAEDDASAEGGETGEDVETPAAPAAEGEEGESRQTGAEPDLGEASAPEEDAVEADEVRL